jgi:protein translocase SEC61 complex gamma subunit
MGLGSFFQSASRLLRTLSRPDWKTYWLSIKIVFVGVAIIGAIGYIVKFIALTFTPIS